MSGALDRHGYMLANALVGNDPGAACLEIIGSGPEFEVACSSVRIALVGSGGGLEIGGRDGPLVPSGQTARLTKGETVRVRLGGDAFCSYLAIEAGFDVPLCLGSRSTYTRAGFGGFSGRLLQSGDMLAWLCRRRRGARRSNAWRTARSCARPADTRGARTAGRLFHGCRDRGIFARHLHHYAGIRPYGASPRGPALEHKSDYNIVSDGIVAGSIQVPGSKLPIVLMADAQTTGGYPKIATVISADLPVLAVRGGGRTVRFQSVSREDAETIRRAEHQRLMGVIREIRPVDATGLNLEALYHQNLIDGVVDAMV